MRSENVKVYFKLLDENQILEKEDDEAVIFARSIMENGGILLVEGEAIDPEAVTRYGMVEVIKSFCGG